MKNHFQEVDCIISCTSAPHTIVRKAELPLKNFLIFDLAMPRDVETQIAQKCEMLKFIILTRLANR